MTSARLGPHHLECAAVAARRLNHKVAKSYERYLKQKLLADALWKWRKG